MRAAVSAENPSPATADPSVVPPIVPYVVSVHCNLHRDLPADGTAREIARMLSLWLEARKSTEAAVQDLLS